MQEREKTKFIITSAGRDALINAAQSGTQDVRLVAMGIGSENYEPANDITELKRIFKLIEAAKVLKSEGSGYILVSFVDDDPEDYLVYEVGIYALVVPKELSEEEVKAKLQEIMTKAKENPAEAVKELILFAVCSSNEAEPCLSKTKLSALMVSFDVLLDISSAGVIVPDGEIPQIPLATDVTPGVVRLATKEEVGLGATSQSVITPSTLMQALRDEKTELFKQLASMIKEEGGDIEVLYSKEPPKSEDMVLGKFIVTPAEYQSGAPDFSGKDSDIQTIRVTDSIPDNAKKGDSFLVTENEN